MEWWGWGAPPSYLSVNAKQLEQPDFQSDPSRCESGHGCHFGNAA